MESGVSCTETPTTMRSIPSMNARLLTAVLCLTAGATGRSAGQATLRSYVVDHERSSLYVVTHKAGLLSFLGHEHALVPEEWKAELCLADPIPRSARATVVIQSRSIVIDTDSARALAGLGGGPGEDDVLEIQVKMLDAEHLDTQAYPEIVLQIDSVSLGGKDGMVGFGRFTLRGITRDVSVPMQVEVLPDGTVRLSGEMRVQQRDFGIEPESTAGLVKVSNDVDLHFLFVAAPSDQPCALGDP